MRIALLVLLGALLAVKPAAAADEPDVVVRKWLVLPPVDVSARRTLRPDAVFARYLLDRTSAPPKEGEEVVGTLGKPAKWAARTAETDPKNDGVLDAKDVGWAYASDRVVMAKLESASFLAVNGAGFTGDVYGLGDVGVPVALRKGANDVYVAGPRGGLRLTLSKPAKDFVLDPARHVVPDRIEGAEDAPELPVGLHALNATTSPTSRLSRDTPIVPLGVGRLSAQHWKEPDAGPPMAKLRKPGEAYRRTFVSAIDGSVQSYALLPPAPSELDKSKIGLVLSLHGASVECMSQARAYAPKPDFWIVCPTNRGNYGFDWQDWGRLDAYEVLDDALKVTGVDPRRVYLTGHSMGGHGTWHLAANDPGRFLAIAPSAGWSCFESLHKPPASPLAALWRGADGSSNTFDLVPNLAPIPTYVIHGEKDDNIPASEAHLMIDLLTKAGGKPLSHFEPEAGHWWDNDKAPGADCVDWPGVWELFRKTQPAEEPPAQFSFVTGDPSIQAERSWIHVLQPIEYGRPSRVSAAWDEKGWAVAFSTENVRRLAWMRPRPESALRQVESRPAPKCVVDGQEADGGNVLLLEGGRWRKQYLSFPEVVEAVKREKRSNRSGPFKRAFARRFVLVYGTAGDAAENRELLEKARFDSLVWAYRANGDATLVSDAQFLVGDFAGRNVVVYGNADTNSAWSAVFDDDCPIQARRGAMTVGGKKHEGVVGAAFVRPRKGSDVALAAAFADTGAAATRLFYQFPVFSSGVGIPDYVVFGPGFLKELDGDVRAAGWFDHAWRMK
jgi:dienelactone hydrolase